VVRLGKEAMAYAQKNGPVILDYIRDQHQTNRAVYLRQWLPGLEDEAGRNASNPWEPSSEEEFGHTPRDDYFKA